MSQSEPSLMTLLFEIVTVLENLKFQQIKLSCSFIYKIQWMNTGEGYFRLMACPVTAFPKLQYNLILRLVACPYFKPPPVTALGNRYPAYIFEI